jgi:hypothetical protein
MLKMKSVGPSNNGWDTSKGFGRIHGHALGLSKRFSHIIYMLQWQVLSTVPINVSFRRALTQEKLIDWYNQVNMISNLRLQEGNDRLFGTFVVMEPSQCALCTF